MTADSKRAFPKSYRFERRPVFSTPDIGTFHALTAVCDDPRFVVWLDRHPHAGVHECHVVTDAMWVYFLIQDNSLDDDVSSSPSPDWQIFRGTMWAWNSTIGGPSPARPDHLVPKQYGGLFPAVKLDDVSRGHVIKMARPALDWWPQVYATDQPVSPNPTRRYIDYGDLAVFL